MRVPTWVIKVKITLIRLFDAFDFGDVLVFAGIGLIGWACWQVDPKLAAVVVGGILLSMGATNKSGGD